MLALDDHVYAPAYEPLYGIVDIIKIDLLLPALASLPDLVAQLKRLPPILLAEKVEAIEQFNQCHSLGFGLFQGFFFAHPVVLEKKRIDLAGTTLLRLLQQLLDDAEIGEIEETFKQNPTLVYNLLRLVNSVSVGLRGKIGTLRHALSMLGRRQLVRWVQLAMFACGDTCRGGDALLEMAAQRGRFMELIVQQNLAKNRSRDYPDRAFMSGVLSLADALFEVPMEEVVCHLSLSDDVRQALLERSGEMGRLIRLTELLEQSDFAAALLLLGQIGISQEQLLLTQLEAINWTHGLGQG
jgi:EAL and modified HD-GYP domain-containing signal transduction protein